MPTITADTPMLVLVNTFEVEPGRADELLRRLAEATEAVMRGRDGFVSASFHRSLDGRHVANYAQWESRAAYDAALADEEVRAHLRRAVAIATRFTPILYEVASTHERAG